MTQQEQRENAQYAPQIAQNVAKRLENDPLFEEGLCRRPRRPRELPDTPERPLRIARDSPLY